MGPSGPTYIYREDIEGVPVIGFSGLEQLAMLPEEPPRIITLTSLPPANHPTLLLMADLTARLNTLGADGRPEFAVFDFSDAENLARYDDNHRRTVSHLLQAHKRLKAQGGGLTVCNHQFQFNPDLQGMFRLSQIIQVFKSREEALAWVHDRRAE